MKTAVYWILPLLFICTLTNCAKDEVQGAKSLVGVWEVVAISSQYGTQVPGGGWSPDEVIDENGNLGTFEFFEDTYRYEFTRVDTLYTGNGSWDLESERVRTGFSTAPEFTLSLENDVQYKVEFEDQTRNAEKNAEKVRFIEEPKNGLFILLELNKQ